VVVEVLRRHRRKARRVLVEELLPLGARDILVWPFATSPLGESSVPMSMVNPVGVQYKTGNRRAGVVQAERNGYTMT